MQIDKLLIQETKYLMNTFLNIAKNHGEKKSSPASLHSDEIIQIEYFSIALSIFRTQTSYNNCPNWTECSPRKSVIPGNYNSLAAGSFA